MRPFFSIVTINFNGGHFIEQTIQSILNQNFKDFEYIVIDGGSTDNSVDIIKKYESQITHWVSEPDNGAADALNKGFKLAKGEYIYYLNSDDLLCKDALEFVQKYIQNKPGYDVYYGHGYIKRGSLKYPVYSSLWSIKWAANGNTRVFQQSHFIKNSVFQKTIGFNLENKTCWDYEILVDMNIQGATFKRYPFHTAIFRIHDASITGSSGNENAYKIDKARIKNKIIESGITLPPRILLSINLFFRDFQTIMKRNFSRVIRKIKNKGL